MTRFRLPLAFLSGLALYAVITYATGYLAAITIPKAYFDLFPRAHLGLALSLESAVVSTLPCFLLALGWTWMTLRALSPTRAVCYSFGGAIAIGFVALTLDMLLEPMMGNGSLANMRFILLFMLISGGILNAFAVPLGATAGILVSRRKLRATTT